MSEKYWLIEGATHPREKKSEKFCMLVEDAETYQDVINLLRQVYPRFQLASCGKCDDLPIGCEPIETGDDYYDDDSCYFPGIQIKKNLNEFLPPSHFNCRSDFGSGHFKLKKLTREERLKLYVNYMSSKIDSDFAREDKGKHSGLVNKEAGRKKKFTMPASYKSMDFYDCCDSDSFKAQNLTRNEMLKLIDEFIDGIIESDISTKDAEKMQDWLDTGTLPTFSDVGLFIQKYGRGNRSKNKAGN